MGSFGFGYAFAQDDKEEKRQDDKEKRTRKRATESRPFSCLY
jgi:hypothetical protein